MRGMCGESDWHGHGSIGMEGERTWQQYDRMTAEAAPGAVVTQIGMYLCCLRMFALSLRGCAVGLSCCYNPDHVLSAGTLSKCFSNAHGTGHNGADDQE